ncbi:MAG TPA: redoxin domain-containing protein [Puia sp.]|nr:redoxin domain-containing protein [Puia sp.]
MKLNNELMAAVKKTIMLCCIICCGWHLDAQSSLATAQLKTLRGKIIPFSEAVQKDSLVLVCFWSVTSDPSINELNAINKSYEKWKTAVPFKLLAVDVDEGNGTSRLRNTVNMYEWKFDVFSDINGDLRKILNSTKVPQALIIKKERVMYELSGFEPGTENYLLQKMQAIVSGKS